MTTPIHLIRQRDEAVRLLAELYQLSRRCGVRLTREQHANIQRIVFRNRALQPKQQESTA